MFIPVSENEYLEIAKEWEFAIIFKVMGRSFSNDYLKMELCKLWNIKRNMDLISLGKGFYSCKCITGEEKSSILVGGPWFLLGHMVWVQPWCPGFQPSVT